MEPENNHSDFVIKPLIMIANGSKISAKLIAKNLNQAGYDTIIASDGFNCLQQLQQLHNQPTRIDCVITSIIMAGMNGYKLITAIKKDELLSKIPILVFSSIADKTEVRLKVIELGVKDIMLITAEPEPLLAKVKDLGSYS